MRRDEKFKLIWTDPFWARKIAKLKHEEVHMISQFLEKHEAMDYNDYIMAVNRMFLSQSGWPQTKNCGIVQEILAALAKTTLGNYGYNGTRQWVHPLDRSKYNGEEWTVEDETKQEIARLIDQSKKKDP